VFDDLGVVERVIANGQLGMPVRTVGADGQVTVSGAESPPERPDVPYLTTLITPEWRIEEALRSRLADFGGEVETREEVRMIVADVGGHLARAYGATDRALVLIRPDGYVGLISDAGDSSAVLNYLAAIG
jgi:hypothetical protein